jgi:hypothetical protein
VIVGEANAPGKLKQFATCEQKSARRILFIFHY